MEGSGEERGERRQRERPDFERAVDLFEGLEDPDVELRRRPEEPADETRASMRGETLRRVLVAIPWIAFAIAITVAGGIPFTVAMIAIGALCLREYLTMASPLRADQRWPPTSPSRRWSSPPTSAPPSTCCWSSPPPSRCCSRFGADRKHRDGITTSMGVTLLGIVWIGIPLAHAVLLRDLPDHGAALLVDVLVGTFASDTGAYATGRMFGSHQIAPNLSPNKTVEGLLGGFVIGTMAFWFAGLYQDWLSGVDALIIGAAVAAIAPVGDLFESMVKRDLGTKDTGKLFGPHGGLLDRLDAVLFTIVVGYYLAVQLVY